MKSLPVLLAGMTLLLLVVFRFVVFEAGTSEEEKTTGEVIETAQQITKALEEPENGGASSTFFTLARKAKLRDHAKTIENKAANLQRQLNSKPSGKANEGLLKTTVPALISIAILFLSLHILLNTKHYNAQDKNWAYGALGSLIGFWLG